MLGQVLCKSVKANLKSSSSKAILSNGDMTKISAAVGFWVSTEWTGQERWGLGKV